MDFDVFSSLHPTQSAKGINIPESFNPCRGTLKQTHFTRSVYCRRRQGIFSESTHEGADGLFPFNVLFSPSVFRSSYFSKGATQCILYYGSITFHFVSRKYHSTFCITGVSLNVQRKLKSSLNSLNTRFFIDNRDVINLSPNENQIFVKQSEYYSIYRLPHCY